MASNKTSSSSSAAAILIISAILLVLILSNAGQTAAAAGMSASAIHSSFLKANYNDKGRRPFMWCANDPGVCSRYHSGLSCCFNRYCRDLSDDCFNCGECGRVCGYGLNCCGGVCVDFNSDNYHCGSCYIACRPQETCTYGMCGYGYGNGYAQVNQAIGPGQ
eukprot:Gb_03934 [translate_table: standard]